MGKISDLISPTPEVITEVMKSYNRLLKRCREASIYLDDKQVPNTEKDKHILAFKVEITDPIEAYLRVLEDWKVKVGPDEILNGFIV